MLNRFILILCSLLLIGCSGSLKSSWTNFRAYYNTFHNAKEYYRSGIEQVEKQPVELDPESPVRVHPPPVMAGDEDFQVAISKGARVLRKFSESKWTDDALLLIGKAYYHRMEFHPALEKFEELYQVTESDNMKHRAIAWKGITLLDLTDYEEGISYLRSERGNASNNWTPSALAEVQVIEAEHHAFLGNWEQSVDLLGSAIFEIENQDLRGRSYFLFGQVLEKAERYGEAYYAYSQVAENFTGFEYNYWAAVKQAQVARLDGNYNFALSLLSKISKDDKYYDRRSEILFQTAQTYEMSGDIETAEELYLNLLSMRNLDQADNSYRSSVYYRLGKIYSESYGQYELAEAYFDSASSLISDKNNISDNEQVETLAKNYRAYNSLKSHIQRADSLLWLGSLPPEKLDSVLQVLKKQKLGEKQKQRTSESIQNMEQTEEDRIASSSSLHGFLNYKNSNMVREAHSEFQLVWGNRPLVDNWRRVEAIENTIAFNKEEISSEQGNNNTGTDEVLLDVSNIPADDNAREKLKQEIISAKYELGNLFFINLERPDSARYYYLQVINQSDSEDTLVPMAMYSLFELYNVQENSDSLQIWGERILYKYPESNFAERVRDRLEITDENKTDSTEKIKAEYRQILSKYENSAPELRSLALANRSNELAPHIHYQAIEEYISQARSRKAAPDSAVSDTSRNVSSTENNSSAYWDSVRIMLQEHISLFSDSPHSQRVSLLLKTLKEQNK